MNLEDHVREAIYTYPSLYRSNNYELSRLKVLDHLFLVIGNGYEWDKGGFLTYNGRAGKSKEKGRKSLPEDFFTKELYHFYVDKDKLKSLKKQLKKEKRFHYFLNKKHRGETEVVFEADEETAKDFVSKYELPDDSPSLKGIVRRWVYVNKASAYPGLSPYPLSDYSAIKEIAAGKTNSLHIENFNLTKVQPDWLAGAVDIAKASLAYYNDPKQYKNHIYCTDRVTGKRSKHWPKFKKEQIKFFGDFIKKFDKV